MDADIRDPERLNRMQMSVDSSPIICTVLTLLFTMHLYCAHVTTSVPTSGINSFKIYRL